MYELTKYLENKYPDAFILRKIGGKEYGNRKIQNKRNRLCSG